MSKQADELQARLAKSLHVTPRALPAHTAPRRAQAGKPLPTVGDHPRIAHPVTFTLNAGDMARLDAVRDFMRDNGARISASEAVKLALRAVKPCRELVQLYEGVKADDGRRKG
jgi:hypothetical protein